MKDQELYDIFHTYRPEIGDEAAFMARLNEQMDAVDKRKGRLHIVRKLMPWAATAAVAAAIVVALIIIEVPSLKSSPASIPVNERVVTFDGRSSTSSIIHSAPTLIGIEEREPGEFGDSFDEIVNEIESSGRQLQQAIAQL